LLFPVKEKLNAEKSKIKIGILHKQVGE